MPEQKHFFGSVETEKKLDCLRRYLESYSIALKNKKFATIYIDAFAGTGNRTETKALLPFFSDGKDQVIEVTTPGSARIALETSPGFHSVVLIERDPERVVTLKKVTAEYPTKNALVREGDANEIVQRICKQYEWYRDGVRGVIFLDPYGMEVNWKTVEAVASTKALDCWYFFPLSGLYRNAPRDPLALDQSKVSALNRVFGTDTWRQDWYQETEVEYDLLGHPINGSKRVADVDRIESWVHERLRTVFRGTVLKPLRLKHSNGAPMASLFFAVSNENKAAVKVATDIASHILKLGISSHVRDR